MAKHVDIHRPNALMTAYNQSRTIPPRAKSSTGLQRANAPIPGDFVPGAGGRDWASQRPTADRSSKPRDRFQGPRQQAPYKPRQTKVTQAYKHAHPGTRPTPGSAYRRRRPRID